MPAFVKRVVAVEALAWAAGMRAAIVDDKAAARAAVLAAAEYDVSAYVAKIVAHDKARELLRAVGQAIRTGKIPAKWDNPDTPGELITTGLKRYDPRVAFQASLRTAYAAGREARIERDPDVEFKIYRTMRDSRVRDSHRVFEGLLLPKTDPVWNVVSAPNGWRCRCRCYGVSVANVERLRARKGLRLQETMPEVPLITHVNKTTGEREALPQGVEPGWGTKPGTAENKQTLAKLLANRARILLQAPLEDM